jgi:CubicO group peptidase (beta-lactamase class C family)
MEKNKIIITIVILLIIPTFATAIPPIENNPTSINDQIIGDFIDAIILEFMNKCHYPSISACIIKNDKVVWSKGYGFSNIHNQISANPNTIYGICSITKTITGMALLQLFDQGFFDLDDDVNDFLPFQLRNPNFPNKSITFRMLLSHSSSLRDAKSYWNVEFYNRGGPPFSNYPSQWLKTVLLSGGDNFNSEYWNDEYSPGEKGFYANINFDVIGYLVELIANEPFHEYCTNHIFQPLEMHNTSFNLSTISINELAVPYNWDNENNQYEPNHNQVHIHYPAGGIFSTVNDLSHFMLAHMNQGVYNGTRILKESTIDEIHSIQSSGNRIGYGLAWLFEPRSLFTASKPIYFPTLRYNGHGGAVTTGLCTQMFIKSRSNTSVLIFTNSDSFMYPQGWNGLQLLRELLFLKSYNYNT